MKDAQALAERRLGARPADAAALVALATLHLRERRLEEAEPLLRRAELVGESPDTLLLRANLAGQRGSLEESGRFFAQAAAADPARAEAHFGLGLLRFKLGDPEGATQALSRAVELEPGSTVFRYRLGQVLVASGRGAEAEAHLRVAIERSPQFVPGYLALAELLRAGGHPLGARHVLRSGLTAVPDQPRLLAAMTALALDSSDVETAYRSASKLAAGRLRDAEAQANVVVLLLARGQAEEALHLCRTVESLGVGTARLKHLEGQALDGLLEPDTEGARAAYERALQLDPAHWGAANDLGELLCRLGAPDELARAVEVLERARQSAPGRPEPLWNLAVATHRLGQREACRRHLGALLAPGASSGALRQQGERLAALLDGPAPADLPEGPPPAEPTAASAFEPLAVPSPAEPEDRSEARRALRLALLDP